jgi:branched-chain amino acid transport system ATP-binding protein
MLLEMKDAVLSYGKIEALHGISVEVAEGEVVSLIGANGAGKTSTMRALSGVRGLHSGSVVFNGEDVTRLRADQRLRKGLVLCPEGRGIFPGMTVTENLTWVPTPARTRAPSTRTTTASSACSRG